MTILVHRSIICVPDSFDHQMLSAVRRTTDDRPLPGEDVSRSPLTQQGEQQMTDDLDQLRERNQLLRAITEQEDQAEWTNLDELRERAELLHTITKLEGDAEWTDLAELRERVELLNAIK
jgi:hypothetical protein